MGAMSLDDLAAVFSSKLDLFAHPLARKSMRCAKTFPSVKRLELQQSGITSMSMGVLWP